MKDFIYHNPDKVYFGRNQIGNLPKEHFKAMAAHACRRGEISGLYPLNAADVEKIYEACS